MAAVAQEDIAGQMLVVFSVHLYADECPACLHLVLASLDEFLVVTHGPAEPGQEAEEAGRVGGGLNPS